MYCQRTTGAIKQSFIRGPACRQAGLLPARTERYVRAGTSCLPRSELCFTTGGAIWVLSYAIINEMSEISTQGKKHYVCYGGCRGVSDKPGVCQAEGCPDHGKPLHECDCEDGEHFQKSEEQPESDNVHE